MTMARSENSRTFPSDVQTSILKRDGHRCQICGRLGPERGGGIDLEAHHMEENPDEIDRNHPRNGTTLCIPCHHLVSHRPTADDLPIDLEAVAAEVNLLYKDIEILMYLYENGAASTSEIRAATSCTGRSAAIERLWTLMSVDSHVESLSEPLIDKDAETDEWGPPGDIESTARGRIPGTEAELMDRLKGELLRRLLENGVPRSAVAEFFGCSKRATFYRAKRAGALRVPFDDSSASNALMSEDEFDHVVDVLTELLGGVDSLQEES
ncbi:hypothetical protein [Halorubellus sp. PRR65]|uniref:hypothetical protein n=1 Tax=Halorubellus sp. PRR65 TaxID=3098148 RepID=UPI002B256FEA|nr:hypothetical protein [Halorubellus sp. PRR65]